MTNLVVQATHLERPRFARFVDPRRHSETLEERREEALRDGGDTISQVFPKQEGASRDIVVLLGDDSDYEFPSSVEFLWTPRLHQISSKSQIGLFTNFLRSDIPSGVPPVFRAPCGENKGNFYTEGIPVGAVGQQKWFGAISLAENASCNVTDEVWILLEHVAKSR